MPFTTEEAGEHLQEAMKHALHVGLSVMESVGGYLEAGGEPPDPVEVVSSAALSGFIKGLTVAILEPERARGILGDVAKVARDCHGQKMLPESREAILAAAKELGL